jgi:hypothetical protein
MPVVLLVILILGASATPSPVQAGRMTWSTVETPSNAFNVVASASEIDFMQIGQDGRTMYTVDTAGRKVYRSDDAGASWLDLSNYLVTAGATLPAWQIAAAPDNPRFVAAVTTTGGMPSRVFVSADGGQNWNDTNLPAAGMISSIAISPNYGAYDIAAGTRAGGSGALFIYRAAGPGGNWSPQQLSGDVLAIKFSPNYRSDPSIAVLLSTTTGTYFEVGVHDLNANVTNWTAIYPGNYPEVTASGAGTSAKAAQVITADLELPADFSGQAPSMSRAYATIDAAGGSAGIFRIDGTVVFQLMTAEPTKRISSIAYRGTYGNGKLLAGEVLGNSVQATVFTWYTDAPTTCPATCWYRADKPATGAGASGYGNAQVAWSPDGRAFCGTSSAPLSGPAAWPSGYLSGAPMDESALSVSTDSGRTWDQLSLIDTQISFLSDIAVSMDANTIYLASINNAGAGLDSIWRSGGQPSGKSWERVLCVPSTSNDIILRNNNVGNDTAIFFASRGTDDLRQSQDNGQTWTAQLPGMAVADFSVTSINNVRYLFALGSSYVRKANATSLIPQWTLQVATNLSASHTIFSAPTGVIVVGGDAMDNRVAFSIDGGSSFNVTTPLFVQGHIHAIADFRIPGTLVIYAAASGPDSDIYALIPGALPWNPMGTPDKGFWGLAQMSTLYGAAAGTIDRTLQPETLGPPAIEWNALNQGLMPGVAFTREPLSLKLCSGTMLWAIDNRSYNYPASNGRLWTFCDCLSPVSQYTPPPPPPREVLFGAPVPFAPRTDDLVPVYINSNTIADITFQWRHTTAARAYELWLAKDGNFSHMVLQKTIVPDNRTAPSWTLADKKALEQGKTYYWKVRVTQAVTGEKGTGDWSQTLPFTIALNESAPGSAAPAPAVHQPVATSDNRTPGSPSNAASKPPASENTSKSLVSTILSDSNLWVWLVAAALAIALIIVVITGIISSRRRI